MLFAVKIKRSPAKVLPKSHNVGTSSALIACSRGVTGSRGAPGDLFRCACGRKVGILHFVGGVRATGFLAKLNESVLGTSGEFLRELARQRAALPEVHPEHEERWRAHVSPGGSVASAA